MKEKILKFFKYDRTYEGAIKLYNEYGQRLSLKKQFNSYPESVLKEVVFDELRQMAEIIPGTFKSIMNTAVIAETQAVAVSAPVTPVKSTAPVKTKGTRKPKGKKKVSAKPVKKSVPAAAKKEVKPAEAKK